MNMTLHDLFTKTNIGRTVSHAVLAFLGALVPVLVFTSVAGLKASVIAAIPAALAVAFRELAPNLPPSGGSDPVPTPVPAAPAPAVDAAPAVPAVTVSDPAPSA